MRITWSPVYLARHFAESAQAAAYSARTSPARSSSGTSGSRITSLLRFAQEFLREEKYPTATYLFMAVLREDPANSEAQAGLDECDRRLDVAYQLAEAARPSREADTKKSALISRSFQHASKGNYRQAADALRQALEIEPNNVKVFCLYMLDDLYARYPSSVALPLDSEYPGNMGKILTIIKTLKLRMSVIIYLVAHMDSALTEEAIARDNKKIHDAIEGGGRVFADLTEAKIASGIIHNPEDAQRIIARIRSEVAAVYDLNIAEVEPPTLVESALPRPPIEPPADKRTRRPAGRPPAAKTASPPAAPTPPPAVPTLPPEPISLSPAAKRTILPQTTLPDILKETAKAYHIKVAAIQKGATVEEIENNEVVEAREVAMFLAEQLLDLPPSQVAKRFNRKNVPAVMRAISRVKQRKQSDTSFRVMLGQIIHTLSKAKS